MRRVLSILLTLLGLAMAGSGLSAAPISASPSRQIQSPHQSLLLCKAPKSYQEALGQQRCEQLCRDLHYACRDGQWKSPNEMQELECSLHDSVCRMEPGMYFNGCPVFSEYLLRACR